jgi:hypothetical protein
VGGDFLTLESRYRQRKNSLAPKSSPGQAFSVAIRFGIEASGSNWSPAPPGCPFALVSSRRLFRDGSFEAARPIRSHRARLSCTSDLRSGHEPASFVGSRSLSAVCSALGTQGPVDAAGQLTGTGGGAGGSGLRFLCMGLSPTPQVVNPEANVSGRKPSETPLHAALDELSGLARLPEKTLSEKALHEASFYEASGGGRSEPAMTSRRENLYFCKLFSVKQFP